MNAWLARSIELAPPPMGEQDVKRVAVLMPAYNPGDQINNAVESLVANTYPCDIYIVDDGSAVPVSQTLRDFSGVTVIRLEENGGVARALNAGLKTILSRSYDFVARMDADDICYPDRIAREVAFLDAHPEIAAVGAWARHIDEETGEPLFIERTPDAPEQVVKALNYNSSVIHITFMIRTDVLKEVGLYSEDYPVAEDYELFRRITRRFPIANIPAVLVDRRLCHQGVSLTRRRKQLGDRLRIQLHYFKPQQLSAWLGVLKTCVLFCVPVALLVKIKKYRDPG